MTLRSLLIFMAEGLGYRRPSFVRPEDRVTERDRMERRQFEADLLALSRATAQVWGRSDEDKEREK